MTIGGAFLGGGVELVPAGSCKLVLEIRTEDGQNLATTFSVVGGGQTYTATAGADGRAELIVPSGVTYTVTTSATGYDGLTAQTVIGDSATVQYVRFEATLPRVKKSGDTVTGVLELKESTNVTISIEKGQAGAGKYRDFTFYDKGDANGANRIRRGNIRCEVGNVQTAVHLRAYKFDGSVGASLTVIQPETGDACALAPSWGIKTVDGATVGTNDESDKIVTLKMLSLDPKVVHTVGNETIGGQKTFSNEIVSNIATGRALTCRFSKYTSGENPTNTIERTVRFEDNNSKNLGHLIYAMHPDGKRHLGLTLLKHNGAYDEIGVYIKPDGTFSSVAPSTPNDANGKEIATANWSIGKFVQKSGDTMTGELTMKKRIQLNYDSPSLFHVDTGGDTKTDTTRNYFTEYYRDKNNRALGIYYARKLDGINVISLNAISYNSSDGQVWGTFGVASDGATGQRWAFAPNWSVGTNDNSDKVLTIQMANSLPSLVHTTGNETIGGDKTFTGAFGLLRAYPQFIVKDTDGDSTVQPSSNQTPFYLQVLDGNGKAFCNLLTVTHRASDNAIVSSFGNSGRTWSGGIKITTLPDGTEYADCPTTPSGATGREIATADWVLGKVPKRTTFSTWAELNALLVNGKPGDMMCITLDYVGDSNINDFTASDVNIHAFGNFTVEELTVSSGKLTKLEAFGGGEIQYNNIRNRYFAMTGFGQMAVGDLIAWAFRVPYGGEMNLMLMMDNKVTSCTGFYVSL